MEPNISMVLLLKMVVGGWVPPPSIIWLPQLHSIGSCLYRQANIQNNSFRRWVNRYYRGRGNSTWNCCFFNENPKVLTMVIPILSCIAYFEPTKNNFQQNHKYNMVTIQKSTYAHYGNTIGVCFKFSLTQIQSQWGQLLVQLANVLPVFQYNRK